MGLVANAGPLIALARIGNDAGAGSLGIGITGTVGILLACKRLGLIAEVTPLLDQLIHRGVRISASLYENARRLAQER